MKNYFTLILILIISTSISAQELPNIPIKNGMAYYSFEHKLNNTTKCLSSYIDGPLDGGMILPFQEKLIKKCVNFSFSNLKVACQLIFARKLVSYKCKDTMKYSSTNFTLMEVGNRWSPSFFSKKAVSSKVTANVSFVFLSKNEYKLIIKDIVYTCGVKDGFKISMNDYEFGEAYENTKKAKKVKKADKRFYNDIDLMMKAIDKLVLDALTDTYRADEL